MIDLEISDWEEIYEYLFGGFEDIGSEDSEDDVDTEDELENIKQKTGVVVKQTKQGYAKDGFIVDDDEEDEDCDGESDDSDDISEDTPPPKKPVTKGRKPAASKSASAPVIKPEPEKELRIEDCESELSEESYD